VITDAVAAYPFPGAGIISAQAGHQVFFLFTFHFFLLILLILHDGKRETFSFSCGINVYKTLKKRFLFVKPERMKGDKPRCSDCFYGGHLVA